ncbi:MAG: class I SAM-dependent methyltransferase [Dehalococcoidia bacterium]
MQEFPPNKQQRLYSDLAWVCPIISPPQGYIEETEQLCEIIRENSKLEVKTLLNLGCGGGHNDCTLKKHFRVMGIDTSEAMLGLATQLNPEVTYSVGDMRTMRLGKTFGAVTIFDSINYMVTVADLQAAFMTAFMHLKPGGVFLTLVEATPERFRQNRSQCTTHASGDIEIVFIENAYDPDPKDTTYEETYVYLIRRGGRLDIETDRHVCGIFRLETWHGLLRKVGFEVKQMEFRPAGLEGEFYPLLVCIKPP